MDPCSFEVISEKVENLNHLHKWLEEQVSSALPLREYQEKHIDDILGTVSERNDDNESRMCYLLQDNIIYGALQAWYPECKVIPIDFEDCECHQEKDGN